MISAVIAIIRFIWTWSQILGPIVITLSGFRCNTVFVCLFQLFLATRDAFDGRTNVLGDLKKKIQIISERWHSFKLPKSNYKVQDYKFQNYKVQNYIAQNYKGWNYKVQNGFIIKVFYMVFNIFWETWKNSIKFLEHFAGFL